MTIRRKDDRLSARLMLWLCILSICIFLVQHRLLSRSGGGSGYGDVAFEILSEFVDPPRGVQQQALQQISGAPLFPVKTCTIFNQTVQVPMVPHFIIAGAQKSGSTALYEFLNEHPNIQASVSREPHFFDWHYPGPIQKEEWLLKRNLSSSTSIPDDDFQCAIKHAYGENFKVLPNTTTDTIFFEKTPSYLFLTKVPELIIATCHDWKPKIVVILRNPVDRAFSHFRMRLRTHGRSFEDLIDEELESLRVVGLSQAPSRTSDYRNNDPGFRIPYLSRSESEEKHWKHYRRMFANNFLQRGMYITQLSHWIRFFPLGESLLVLNYERFRSHPKDVYLQLLEFVGAPPFIPAQGFSKEHNSHGPLEQPMSNATRIYLSALFRPYNNMLADLLGEKWAGVWE